MSDLDAGRKKYKSILSSLTALGASELPLTSNSVPRNRLLASVAAAGVSLLACQSAEAEAISVFDPDVNVGFAAGALSSFKLNIASLTHGGLKLQRKPGQGRSLSFKGTTATGNNHVEFRISGGAAGTAAYGKKFSQFGTGSSQPRITIQSADPGGTLRRGDFSQKYFAFYFLDASSLSHYGWTYGSLTGDYSDLTYNLISYAYDTTPGVMIKTGQTQDTPPTPEPSTIVLGAMAALILGAAGVRKRNRAQA